MVRLADLSAEERDNHLSKLPELQPLAGHPWVRKGPLAKRRVAIITTAGIHLRGERTFGTGAAGADYRVIPEDAPADALVMSHVSVNYDRSGFQADANVVFPLDRLRELAQEGLVGSVARFHYSFMGAVAPLELYAPRAREVAALLREDGVDGVILSPV